MSDKKKCPELFIAVGAASVLLRHAIDDLKPLFDDLKTKLASTHDELIANGIARMEISPGERLLHSAEGAIFDIMAAHDSWRSMLDRHGIQTPTDDDIKAVHKAQHEKKALRVKPATAEKLVTFGNGR